MKTNRLLCVALLCAVGCAGTNTATTTSPLVEPVAPAMHHGGDGGIENWIPNIFADLWETMSLHLGDEYGWGLHVQATDLFQVGIFDYSDFSVLGVESDIFHGEWACPFTEREDWRDGFDFSAKVGLGDFGLGFRARLWEFVDLLSTIVGFGYWSLDGD